MVWVSVPTETMRLDQVIETMCTNKCKISKRMFDETRDIMGTVNSQRLSLDRMDAVYRVLGVIDKFSIK